MKNPAVMLPFKAVSEAFDYFPETGKVYLKGKDKPLASLTKNRTAIRAQIQTDDFYKDSTAHAVAWVLLTGRDLMKSEKPCHINGNKMDNRAVNLYLEELDYNDNSTTYLPDTKLARLLFPAGELCRGLWKANGTIYGDFSGHFVGGAYMSHLYDAECLRTGCRPPYMMSTEAGRAAMAEAGYGVLDWDEFFSRTTIDLDDFAAWLEAKRDALDAAAARFLAKENAPAGGFYL